MQSHTKWYAALAVVGVLVISLCAYWLAVHGGEREQGEVAQTPESYPSVDIDGQEDGDNLTDVSSRRRVILGGPADWRPRKSCRVRVFGLSSGHQSNPTAPTRDGNDWVVTEDADWPKDRGLLLVVSHGNVTAGEDSRFDEDFCECFIVNNSASTVSLTVRPPAAVLSITVTARDRGTRNTIPADLTIFSSRRAVLSILGKRLSEAQQVVERRQLISDVVVTHRSTSLLNRVARGRSPLTLEAMEIDSPLVVQGMCEGYKDTTIESVVAKKEVYVDFGATNSLTVEVEDLADLGAHSYRFGFAYPKPADASPVQMRQIDRSRAYFYGLRLGDARVAVSQGKRMVRRDITIGRGSNTVRLTLPAEETPPLLRLRLQSKDGMPVRGLQVSATSFATGAGNALTVDHGEIAEWDARLLPPIRLHVYDRWGVLTRPFPPPDGYIIDEFDNELALNVADDRPDLARLILEAPPGKVDRVAVSYWIHYNIPGPGNGVKHIHPQLHVMPQSGELSLGEVPYGVVMARAMNGGVKASVTRIEVGRRFTDSDDTIRVKLETPLSRAAEAHRIRFVDVDSGRPLPSGLRVMVDKVGYNSQLLELKEGGVLTFQGFSPGEYNLAFVGETYTPADGKAAFTVNTATDPRQIEFTASKGGRSTITLKFEGNEFRSLQMEPLDLDLGLKFEDFEIDDTGEVTISNYMSGAFSVGLELRDGKLLAGGKSLGEVQPLEIYIPPGKSVFHIRYTTNGWDVTRT